MPHPSTDSFTGGGISFGAPSCAPPFTQVTSLRISAGESDLSLEKCPYCGSAYHGGMIFCVTTILIVEAHGLVSLYVSIENGAASLGRLHVWQCFCRIGATSFEN